MNGDSMLSAARTTGFVYMAISPADSLVKIGWSTNPFVRIRSLRTGNSQNLALSRIVPGTRRLEGVLHKHFAALRVRGEWFDDADNQIAAAFSLLGAPK